MTIATVCDGSAAVTLVERDEPSLQRSLASIKAVYASRVRRKKMTPTQAADAGTHPPGLRFTSPSRIPLGL